MAILGAILILASLAGQAYTVYQDYKLDRETMSRREWVVEELV